MGAWPSPPSFVASSNGTDAVLGGSLYAYFLALVSRAWSSFRLVLVQGVKGAEYQNIGRMQISTRVLICSGR